jgi:hypothetical protein
MKWGSPHEQRELSVRHTRKRIWVTRQLKCPGEKGEIVKESFWKEQAPPIQAINGQLPALVNVQEEIKEVEVPQKSLVSADVDIELRNNPRRLGNANYGRV